MEDMNTSAAAAAAVVSFFSQYTLEVLEKATRSKAVAAPAEN